MMPAKRTPTKVSIILAPLMHPMKMSGTKDKAPMMSAKKPAKRRKIGKSK